MIEKAPAIQINKGKATWHKNINQSSLTETPQSGISSKLSHNRYRRLYEMTTQEFIKKTAGVPSTKDRHCSSVFADQDGNIFSYGYHYPLLFTIEGITFVNNAGYSSSTGKHIAWAKSAMNYNAINLWVSGCNQYSWRNGENAAKLPNLLNLTKYGADSKITKAMKKAVLADLEAEKADIQSRIDSKKRTDTAIYRGLIGEYNDCIARLNLVKKAWGLN